MKSLKILISIAFIGLISVQAFADVNPADKKRSNKKSVRAAGCDPAKTSSDLNSNNVVARIHTGGDMWWDLQGKAQYEVPKGSGRHSLFAGSIWVGGKDATGQLKLAAMRFRQRGQDFWPGPLITEGPSIASVTPDICRKYDQHFEISKEMVETFREYLDKDNDESKFEEEYPNYSIPEQILNWPAHGEDGGYDYYMAPFYDSDGDGYYDPYQGDFPYYEFKNDGITDDPECDRPRNRMPKLFGDTTLWWVYNDKGNIHTETGGEGIGMEFKAQAFTFSTNDELNNMTFYNYNIINRSTFTLNQTYFGVWTDADLGGADDDYTGCDVLRGLGYMYNADDFDDDKGSNKGYGAQPPAIGIDFFEGPYQDPDGKANSWSFDTINGVKVINCTKGDILNGNINGLNFDDNIVDNERWGMRRFIYFNNDGSSNGDPVEAIEYYNYLTGFWKDNSPLTYGGNGHFSGGVVGVKTDFMFPDDTDVCGWGQGGIPQDPWSEITNGNDEGDRRFVQSAGPFTLMPGAVNDITIGAVWARAVSGGAWESVNAVRVADDKAQTLFETCFRVLDGPDAPELSIVELDKKLIFHIITKPSSNNYLEIYEDEDPGIKCKEGVDCDKFYRFQGYQVFQLANNTSNITDREDDNKVRLVFQCDIKDDVDRIINYQNIDDLNAFQPKLMVNGANNGITHTFEINEDAFAKSDKILINHKEYYYTVIAYSYNEFAPYNQQDASTIAGQKKPYLAGRKNIKNFTAMPHFSSNLDDGTVVNADFGYGPKITMIEGMGNENNVLDLTEESIATIMKGEPWKVEQPEYNNGRGPININIIDPLNVPSGNYTLKFDPDSDNKPWSYGLLRDGGKWVLIDDKGIETKSDYLISSNASDQLFLDYGFSIEIGQVAFPLKDDNDENNGFIEATVINTDETKSWLNFLTDGEGENAENWIRLGSYDAGTEGNKNYNDYKGRDDDEYFEKILGGSWGPYKYTSDYIYGPAFAPSTSSTAYLDDRYAPLSSVDIVFTSDRSKWSRSVVFEMCENELKTNDDGFLEEVKPLVNHRSIGNALKFDLRLSSSVDKDGNSLDDDTHGLGWFPGYAIDVRTGERLNIAFGEDSWLVGANGSDMIWNPTSQRYSNSGQPVFGGKHNIYVFGHHEYYDGNEVVDNRTSPAYDGCQDVYNKMMEYKETKTPTLKTKALQGAMWTAIPLLRSDAKLLDTEVKIRIRVATPYYQARAGYAKENPINSNYPMFTFDMSDVSTVTGNTNVAEEALESIRVVPNPYYAHSAYETNQLDNRVRITNLPRKCTVSIYNVAGVLIRRFSKNNGSTYIDWDLRNFDNINIAGGMYIVHIEAPGIGEKVVKWFGALRPVDLQNF